MSMPERGRGAHLVRRGRSQQDPEIAALLDRGHSPLEANWRMRVRGNGRPPLRPHGVQPTAPFLDVDVESEDADRLEPTNGTVQPLRLPSENGSSEEGELGVLVFPEIVLPPAEKPVRGPLSWAYWSARRRQA